MEKLISEFPQNIIDALQIASKVEVKNTNQEIRNIVICGMGGSGIGGEIVAKWSQNEITIPVATCHDYILPNFVNQYTLVLGSSYSGNTEETMISLESAKQKGARIIGICSGGQLKEFCESNNYDFVVVPGGNPPRTALAFSLIQLVNIFVQLGFMDFSALKSLESAGILIQNNQEQIKKEALELAHFLKNKVGVFYSTAAYEPIIIRARQQFNENSKLLCWHHVIPEMNHNELVGWGGGDNRFATVFFDTKDIFPRNKKRFEITVNQIKTKTDYVKIIEAIGSNQIERSIYMINLVDWSSYFLSELNQVDVMDIKIIDYLKEELSKF
ncbi:MAG: bifunctional phosphoglucose/phosphomannose isomerase [Flavobacteriia bacterium]|nr:bifunctional phosphoglucose/phosphomannose isomerase [Flavobacteriia bacterium]